MFLTYREAALVERLAEACEKVTETNCVDPVLLRKEEDLLFALRDELRKL